MKRLILALAIITVALSGCTEKAPTSGEIKTLMVHSAANLSSYSFAVSDNQTESIRDLIKNNITNTYNISTRSVKTDVLAAVDLASRKAMANLTTTTVIKGPTGKPNVVTSRGLEYDIGNTTYITRDNSNWTQLKDNQSAETLWGMGKYNLLKSRVDSVNQSKIELMGSESVDGKDCYKLKLDADNQTYLGNAYNMLTSVLFPFVPDVNQTDLINSSKNENFVWVEKDNNQLKKYESTLDMKITPKLIGVVNLNTGVVQRLNQTLRLVEISIDTDSIETYSDYDKPVAIIVPKAALNTTPIMPSTVQGTAASTPASG